MKFLKPFLGTCALLTSFFFASSVFAVAPQGTNLSAAETYTEDTSLNLIDIVASDVDSSTLTVILTLSNPVVGSLSTGTSGATTSTYNAGTGVWTVSGAIADVNVLLAGVTFVPTANGNVSFTIATSISDGGSSVTGTKAVTGVAVNDAPILDASKTPGLSSILEDTSAPTGAVGDFVSSLVDFASPAGQVDNVTDIDTSPSLGIAITAVNSQVSCYYSTDNGSSWSSVGSVSNSSARLLAANGSNRVYCKGNADVSGTIVNIITFRAWDQTSGSGGGTADTTSSGGSTAFSSVTDGVSLTIIAINDAPVLDTSKSPVMVSVTQDAGTPVGAVGTMISSLVDATPPAGGLDNVSDVDSGASLGIAITGADSTNITYYYSTDNGSTWNALGAVSNTSARLLAANGTDRIYGKPAPAFTGTVSTALTFRAWDQTSGVDGGTANTASNGGSTAFSTATDTASLVVTTPNIAPVAIDDSFTFDEDTPTALPVLGNDTDSNGDALVVSAVGSASHGDVSIVGGATQVSYTPNTNYCGADSFDYTVSDGNGGTDTGNVIVDITCINDAPIANDDNYSVLENADSSGLAILNNDTDVENDTLELVSVTSPDHGGSAILGSDVIIYTPATDFVGTETFSYTVSDGHGGSATGNVSINVALVDVTAPDTIIISSTAPHVNSDAATFEFESNDGTATFECGIDAGAGPSYLSCTSPFTSPTLSLGSTYTFWVRAKDPSNNVDATPAHVTWTILNSSVTTVSPANDAKNVSVKSSIIFHFSSSVPESLVNHITITTSPCGESCPTLDGVWSDGNTVLTYNQSGNPFKYDTTYNISLLADNGITTESLYDGSFTTNAHNKGYGYVSRRDVPVTTSVSVPVFKLLRVLKFGMTGDDVKNLQKYLNSNGFTVTPPGQETKRFGSKTRATVVRFQKSHQLTFDGIVGPGTAKAMGWSF